MSLATTIYQYPTIKLCEFVENTKAAKPLVSHSNIKRELNGDIAIIGMAGRFPGSTND
jgi:hypothetical protein